MTLSETPDGPGPRWVDALESARAAERRQTRFYRALAAEAGEAGDLPGEERLNELHADEQHHLARITARLLELGHSPRELAGPRPGDTLPWPDWESSARAREEEEIRLYEGLLGGTELDAVTRAILEEILGSERDHARVLGGKWMPASPGGSLE